MPDVSLVWIVLIAWGKKDMVVPKAAKYPMISVIDMGFCIKYLKLIKLIPGRGLNQLLMRHFTKHAIFIAVGKINNQADDQPD